jgi:arylsulfatase A-like enzyme
VPALIRWPGVIKPGQVIDGIGSHEDMLPTLLAAAEPRGSMIIIQSITFEDA